nr:MAG TPA: hypothetical protein [Caudoviricetes sp.]
MLFFIVFIIKSFISSCDLNTSSFRILSRYFTLFFSPLCSNHL